MKHENAFQLHQANPVVDPCHSIQLVLFSDLESRVESLGLHTACGAA